MEKLKIELFRYGTLVFGKVLEMDESLRNKEKIESNDNFEVRSSSYPALYGAELYVRGNQIGCDNNPFAYCFKTEEAAIEACNNIKELVDKINSKDEKLVSSTNVVKVL